MAWIKRNLYFVIIAVVGLGVTGYCAYLLLSAVHNNRGVSDEYAGTISQLTTLQQKPPFPSKENIAGAKAESERVKIFLGDFRKAFAPFPVPPNEDERGFKDHLQGTIYQWGLEATNAGVLLPDNYSFSFSQIKDKLNYPPEAINPWLQQVEEIRVILHILFKAKILYLEGVQRCPVTPDDYGGNDCIYASTITNQWGLVTPYKVMFRGFSTEIAAVMAGFAGASNCFIVKDVDVSQSRAALPTVVTPPPMSPAPGSLERPRSFRDRDMPRSRGRGEGDDNYNNNYRRRPPPSGQPVIVAPTGPQTILTESLLFVTISVDIVKLKSADAAKTNSVIVGKTNSVSVSKPESPPPL
jgi:hypothetical protein